MGYKEHEFRRLDQHTGNLRPRHNVKCLPNPELKLVFDGKSWHEKRLSYRQTQERIHRNVTRKCTRCLGSGHYFDSRCETCSGWGENMVLRGVNDVRKST